MFTNNIRKEKKNKSFEKETDNLKKELHSLKRLKKQNNNAIFYNSEFINSLQPKQTSHKFLLIKSIPVVNINEEYLKKQYEGNNKQNILLTNRTQNHDIENNFCLIFKKSKNQNIRIEEKTSESFNEKLIIDSDSDSDSDDHHEDNKDIDNNYELDLKEFDNENNILIKTKYRKEVDVKNTISNSNTKKQKLNMNILKEYLRNGNEIKYYEYNYNIQEEEKNVIPLVCYTTWHTKNLPPLMKTNYTELCNNNSEIKFLLFDENECKIFIRNNFSTEVYNAYNILSPSSYKADLWRYCVLFINGGIYLDIKYNTVNNFQLKNLCLQEHYTFDHMGKNNSFWEENEFGIYTSLIVSKPKNNILKICIDKIVENVEVYYYGKNALYPTGPGILGKVFKNEKYSENMEFIKEADIFHHEESNAIVYKNTVILDVYNSYREEQKEYQSNLHYSELWKQRNIYNMEYYVLQKKISKTKEEHLPNVVCIVHVGSYHIFLKIKDYIDNLIRAKYDQYNLDIYINIINTLKSEHIVQIKQMYPEENIIVSQNYGFDIGSFFHTLQLIKSYNEHYDYIVKLHTKTNNTLRNELINPILGDIQTIRKIVENFQEDSKIGIIAAKKSRCIDAQADFLRNKMYLQQFLFWFFNEKTNVIKQVYPTGTIFWGRFNIFKQVFFKYDIANIFNSFNNTNTFDFNWYYFANKKYLQNINQDPEKLYIHFCENKEKYNLSGNMFHCLKYNTNSEPIRDGMIEHAYERFFGYLNHRLGCKFKFMD